MNVELGRAITSLPSQNTSIAHFLPDTCKFFAYKHDNAATGGHINVKVPHTIFMRAFLDKKGDIKKRNIKIKKTMSLM